MTIRTKTSFPLVAITNDSIQVDLRSADPDHAKQVIVSSIVDEGPLGDVLGVEILDLSDQLGQGALSFWSKREKPFSYDEDAEALYVCIRTGQAPRQRSADAHLFLDNDGLFRVVLQLEQEIGYES